MPYRLLYLTGAPLWERFRRREGALLAVNTTVVVFAQPPALEGAIQIAMSALVLAVVYAVNDWHDAEEDRKNPKKNQRLVEALVALRRPFFAWLCAMQIALVLFALAALGPAAALVVAAMIAINFTYSWWLKGVPIADLLVVWAWGATYTAIVAPPWLLCVTVGLMTAIMHVFQIREDRDVDT
ncbi:MAG: UbiA family prenyltransferase, partial [Planctomycetota bacterium]